MESAPQIRNEIGENLWTRSNQLARIHSTSTQYAGMGRYTARLQRFIQFVIRCIEEGADGLAVTYAQIVRAQKDAGQPFSSPSTLRLQLQEAEQHGFVWRDTFKIGPMSSKTVIHFNLARFQYWLTPRAHIAPVSPDYINAELAASRCEKYAEDAHTDLHGQKLAGVDATGDPSDSPTSRSSVETAPRARGKRFKNKTRGKGKGERRYHPIVYSVMMATRGMPRERRKRIVALAKHEASRPSKRPRQSPWTQWDKRDQRTGRIAFEELTIPHEREWVVREQFVPYFEEVLGMEKIETVVREIVKQGAEPRSAEQLQEDQERERINQETLAGPPDPDAEPEPTAADMRSRRKDTRPDQAGSPGGPVELPSKEQVRAMLRAGGLDKALRIVSEAPEDDPPDPSGLDPDTRRKLEEAKRRAEQAAATR